MMKKLKLKLKLKLILILSASLFVSGCTTIHFDNGQQLATNNVTTQKWHHNVVFSLYELSEPVNLDKECVSAPWASVKTEKTFINGLAASVTNSIGPIWYPKTVEVTCSK
jgi:hypothetical protein